MLKQPILSTLYLARQIILAGIVLTIVLAFYNKVSSHPIFNAIGLTSVAASLFIIFTAPHTLAGQNKAIIGGYAIGIAVGIGCHALLHYMPALSQLPLSLQPYYPLLCGGLSLTLCLLLMVILQMPHPPAAGLALGIVIDAWEAQSIIIIAGLIVALTLFKHLLGFKPLIK